MVSLLNPHTYNQRTDGLKRTRFRVFSNSRSSLEPRGMDFSLGAARSSPIQLFPNTMKITIPCVVYMLWEDFTKGVYITSPRHGTRRYYIVCIGPSCMNG